MLSEYRNNRPIRVTRPDGFEAWFRPDWSYSLTLERARKQFGQAIPDERSAKQRLLTGLLAARKLARATFQELFTYDMWAVGMCRHQLAELDELRRLAWEWLPEPGPRTYEADPFAYRDERGWHLLLERHTHGRKAFIVNERGQAMTSGCHHSYPYVLTHQGQHYCLPESVEDRALRLYRILDHALEYHSTLKQAVAADPVLFEHHGRWWLLYTGTSQHGAYRLEAHYGDSPFGPFQPHPLNPIKQDIRGARNGGKPFRLGGQLYRPTQDCSQGYGRALVVQHVTELTPTSFREQPVLRLEPREPYPDGLHHLVVEDGLILIDGKRVVTDPWFPLRKR